MAVVVAAVTGALPAAAKADRAEAEAAADSEFLL